MADPTIPDDLLDKLVRAYHDAGAFCGECDYESALDEDNGCRWCQRYLTGYARAALAALAEWADGALLDPSTWTRVRAEHVADFDWDLNDDTGLADPYACNWSLDEDLIGSLTAGHALHVLTREDPT